MFCLFDNIYICGTNELETLNLANFSYILNCSLRLNNFIQNTNYINLNFDKPINLLIENIIQILDFIYNSCVSNCKIILLDETGKDNSIFIGIMFLMKLYNLNFDSIYNSLSKYLSIHPKEYYNSILSVEYFIIKNIYNNQLLQPTQPTQFTQPKLFAQPTQFTQPKLFAQPIQFIKPHKEVKINEMIIE